MVQDDTYERFWYEFVKGYIHRDIDNNPISHNPFYEFDEENPLSFQGFGKKKHDAFIRYKRSRRHIMRDKELLKPFFNLWPRYPSQACFFTEFKYEVTIKQSMIYDIINYIDRQYQNEPDLIKSATYMHQLVNLTAQTQINFTQKSDEIHLKPHIKDKTNDNKLCNHAYIPQKQFETLLYHKFPSSFAETLMNKFLIEGVTASRWIVEYLKFMCLTTLSKSELFSKWYCR